MMWYIYALLGILIRRQAFEVNNGNDDWMDLVHPEKYGLTETQNFYMQVSNITSSKVVSLLISNKFIQYKNFLPKKDNTTCITKTYLIAITASLTTLVSLSSLLIVESPYPLGSKVRV